MPVEIDCTELKLITPQEDYVKIDYSDRPEENEPERRTKYNTLLKPRFNEVVQWIAEGNNDYSIAEKIGVHYNTLSRWKKENNEFAELYSRAQDARNCLTMNSMFKRGNGIRVHLKKQKVLANGDIKDYIEEQYFPPDVNAADLYLRNNDPEYRSARSVESGGNITFNFQLPQIQAELQKLDEQEKILQMQLNQGVYELKE
jgi:hypothetical protein